MQFRWPFPTKSFRQPADEQALSTARTELAMAETALDAARTAYLRLQEASQPAKLRLQQSVLDDALHRYHAARQTVRAMERQSIAAAARADAARRPAGVPSPKADRG